MSYIFNYPCRCGHEQLFHATGFWSMCLKSNNSKKSRECNCDKFIPDNLKYLEFKSERNN
jgi:hypothetical protein